MPFDTVIESAAKKILSCESVLWLRFILEWSRGVLRYLYGKIKKQKQLKALS